MIFDFEIINLNQIPDLLVFIFSSDFLKMNNEIEETKEIDEEFDIEPSYTKTYFYLHNNIN